MEQPKLPNIINLASLREKANQIFDIQCQGMGKDMLIPSLALALGDPTDAETWTYNLVMLSEFNENRYELMRMLGAECAQADLQVCAIFLTTEVWRSEYHDEIPKDRPLPSEDPDHKEALNTMAMGLDLQTVSIMADFTRDANGVPEFSKIEIVDSDTPNIAFQYDILEAFMFPFLQAVVARVKARASAAEARLN